MILVASLHSMVSVLYLSSQLSLVILVVVVVAAAAAVVVIVCVVVVAGGSESFVGRALQAAGTLS